LVHVVADGGKPPAETALHAVARLCALEAFKRESRVLDEHVEKVLLGFVSLLHRAGRGSDERWALFALTPVKLCNSAGVDQCMPQRKKLSYKAMVGRLIMSKRLSLGEQAAFEEMQKELSLGRELTEHQKLWVESLRHRTDPA
jgi:hypothetical protein